MSIRPNDPASASAVGNTLEEAVGTMDGAGTGSGIGADGEQDRDDDPLRGMDPELARLLRHDIKTPLQAASLNLELLALEHEEDASVLEAIASIQESLDDAVAMLSRFDRS